MDPSGLLKGILTVAQVIYNQVELVKANQLQTKRLVDRVRIIVSTVEGLAALPRQDNFIQALCSLQKTLSDIRDFLIQFADRHWLKKIVFAGSYEKEFIAYTQRLAEVIPQLGIALSAQQIMNDDEDARYAEQDRVFLRHELEKIATEQKKIMGAVCSIPEAVECIVKKYMEALNDRLQQSALPVKVASSSMLPDFLQVNFCDVKLNQQVGSSFSSVVFEAEYQHQRVAAKIVYNGFSASLQQSFIREAQILHRLNHEDIVRFYGASFDERSLCILTELMPQGNLLSRLKNISYNDAIDVAVSLSRALGFAHQQGIVHGNLHPAKVLFDQQGRAKLGGFRLAKVSHQAIQTAAGSSQSARWQAPESWQQRAALTPASDVYSLGMLLWSMFSRQLPYEGIEEAHLISKVKEGYRENKDKLPERVSELISRCWHTDPIVRPSINEVLTELVSLQKTELEQTMPSPDLSSLVDRSASPLAETLYEEAEKDRLLKRYPEAFAKYQRAFEKGSVSALGNLGIFYQSGLGVSKNPEKALDCLRRAADQGHHRSCYNLGRVYEKGEGVLQNYDEALKYYERAYELNRSEDYRKKVESVRIEIQKREATSSGYLFSKK